MSYHQLEVITVASQAYRPVIHTDPRACIGLLCRYACQRDSGYVVTFLLHVCFHWNDV